MEKVLYVTVDQIIYITGGILTLVAGIAAFFQNKVSANRARALNNSTLLGVLREQFGEQKNKTEAELNLLEHRLKRLEESRNNDMKNTAEIFSRVDVTLVKLNSTLNTLNEFSKEMKDDFKIFKKETAEGFKRLEDKLDKKQDKRNK